MKKIIYFLIFIFLLTFTISADDTSIQDYIIQSPRPVYPKSLMAENFEGTVRIKVDIDNTGYMKNIEIIQSSGIEPVDVVSKNTIKMGWRFKPAGYDYSLITEVNYIIDDQGDHDTSVTLIDLVIEEPEENNAALSSSSSLGKAFRDINFGDSQNIVEIKIENDIKILEKYHGLYEYEIGEIPYRVYFDYYQDQLCSVKIKSNDEMANYFDTKIKNQRDTLVDVITKAYDEPSRTYDVNFFDMQSGYIKYSHIWYEDKFDNTGKIIKIGLGEYDATYYSAMYIEYRPFIEAKEAEESKKEKDTIEDSSNDF